MIEKMSIIRYQYTVAFAGVNRAWRIRSNLVGLV